MVFASSFFLIRPNPRIRITPEGVDGSGPLYERVAAIADDWLKEHGLA